MSRDAKAPDDEIQRFLESIRDRYGYDFVDYARTSMARLVRASVTKGGYGTVAALQEKVLADHHAFTQVLSDLTVKVSEMFRDPIVHRVLRNMVFPVLRTYPLLKIWHAGCANGEEVYANAIALTEVGLYERAQLYATDVSWEAVERAKEGTYSSQHVPRYVSNHTVAGGTTAFSDHCTQAYGAIAMSAALKRHVAFFQHDLGADHPFGEMQLIFCRNVLIYFGRELRARVLEKLKASLCGGGFLCLGTSERLSTAEMGDDFTEFAPPHRIYRYQA